MLTPPNSYHHDMVALIPVTKGTSMKKVVQALLQQCRSIGLQCSPAKAILILPSNKHDERIDHSLSPSEPVGIICVSELGRVASHFSGEPSVPLIDI